MQSPVAILGWPEISAILIILLIILGARKIPELLGGMRRGFHEFIQATRELEVEVARALESEANAGDGRGSQPYGFKFWFIVGLGVAVALRELFP